MTLMLNFNLCFAIMGMFVATVVCAQQSVPNNVQLHRQGQEPLGYAPCEPSIAIDPTNPDRIVAGAVLDYVYVSDDAGKSWSRDRLTSEAGCFWRPVYRRRTSRRLLLCPFE